MDVTMNTPRSSIFYGSSTDGMHTALMNKRLNAAEPTMVDGPSSPAGSPSLPHVSTTASKISGAEDPRAMSERFAMVAFQTGTSTFTVYPVASMISIDYTVEVISSMASMNKSAIRAIPTKR